MKVERISAFAYNNTGGNPAGVVFSDEMLSNEEMLKISSEVNYSETAFLVKQDDSFRIRYFSPEMEIEFCGHATIASASSLANKYGLGKYNLILNGGNIEVDVSKKNDKNIASIKSLRTSSKDIAKDVLEDIIKSFNFSFEDLDKDFPVKISFSGNDHLILFVKDKKTLENMDYDFEKIKEIVRRENITTISVLYKENDSLFHSRNAFAFGGVFEDPATGSAAIALGEYLRHTKIKTSGEIEILQGFDMKQPSLLYVSYKQEEGSAINVAGFAREIK
jgi:PhzF family phenazine biosynthesis protein